jgi:hypothetical protein
MLILIALVQSMTCSLPAGSRPLGVGHRWNPSGLVGAQHPWYRRCRRTTLKNGLCSRRRRRRRYRARVDPGQLVRLDNIQALLHFFYLDSYHC